MAHRDRTSTLAMQLAMAATAWSNHRGRDNQERLAQSITDILPLLPVTECRILPGKIHAIQIVKSALACGRSAGLSWHEMSVLFNEVNEQLPPPLPVAFKNLQRDLKGTLQ